MYICIPIHIVVASYIYIPAHTCILTYKLLSGSQRLPMLCTPNWSPSESEFRYAKARVPSTGSSFARSILPLSSGFRV